jgi:oxygen-dependent protoporphyrinogen oxidase
VLLAGDYLGTLYTETAITTAFTAAERAQQILGTAASATASPTPHDTRTHLTEESS